MDIALSSCENGATGIGSDRNLSELEYAVNTVLLNEDPGKVQTFRLHLSNSMHDAFIV